MTIFIADFVVNVFEIIAMICLMLPLFRFPIRFYLTQMIITSIVMAQTSYLVREVFHLEAYTPLFMMAWIITLLWLLFRVHFFYALLMSVTGYLAYVAIQMVIIFIAQLVVPFDVLTKQFDYQKMVQIISSICTLAVSFALARKRIGFSFVPDWSTGKVPMNKVNRVLVSVIVISSITISAVGYYTFDGVKEFILYMCTSLLIILMVLRLILWRETKDD